MQTILYHNSSGYEAFTGNLKQKEVNRAITLHPVKQHQYMYKIHNYMRVRHMFSFEECLAAILVIFGQDQSLYQVPLLPGSQRSSNFSLTLPKCAGAVSCLKSGGTEAVHETVLSLGI